MARVISTGRQDFETMHNDFITSLLAGDEKGVNRYMNNVALKTFSYFDTGKNPSEHEPERFHAKDLEETTAAALSQIEEKQYAGILLAKGIPADKIRSYGFAFEGKTVLIRGGQGA